MYFSTITNLSQVQLNQAMWSIRTDLFYCRILKGNNISSAKYYLNRARDKALLLKEIINKQEITVTKII